jgi:hypothetical protein
VSKRGRFLKSHKDVVPSIKCVRFCWRRLEIVSWQVVSLKLLRIAWFKGQFKPTAALRTLWADKLSKATRIDKKCWREICSLCKVSPQSLYKRIELVLMKTSLCVRSLSSKTICSATDNCCQFKKCPWNSSFFLRKASPNPKVPFFRINPPC